MTPTDRQPKNGAGRDKGLTRRSFLGGALGLLVAGAAAAGSARRGAVVPRPGQDATSLRSPRRRLPNPYQEGGKPVVVVVRGTDFAAMLAKAMAALGGFARFGAAHPVVVKPNFVFDKVTRYPTTSDEGAVLTLVEFLQKEGFRDITVADRRGKKAADGRAGGKFEWSGLNDKAEAGGFKTDSLLDNDVAPTVMVKDDRWTELPAYGVLKAIYDAPLIINMPTLKRHAMSALSGSLKNLMGVLDVPTTETMHLWLPEQKARHDALSKDELDRRLCASIAEAASAVNPELTVIDARTVLRRHHLDHVSGGPVAANRLIISGDAVAAERAAVDVLKEAAPEYELGIGREMLDRAAALGLGAADPSGFVLKVMDA